jgi:hypothetical protein
MSLQQLSKKKTISRQPNKVYPPFADTDHLSIFDKPPSTTILYEGEGPILVILISNFRTLAFRANYIFEDSQRFADN